MFRRNLPPPSVDDAWRVIAGDPRSVAHLFPVGGGWCLCRRFPGSFAGPVTSCQGHPSARGGRPYALHCQECQELHDDRWLLGVDPATLAPSTGDRNDTLRT